MWKVAGRSFLSFSSGKELGDRVPGLLELWASVPLSFLTFKFISVTVLPLR